MVKRLWNHIHQVHEKKGETLGLYKRRMKWSVEEEKVLREELEVTKKVPNRKDCDSIIKNHSNIFLGRSKVHVQDKIRRIMKKT